LSATDGEQAVSTFEAYSVDLVLLDYAMPCPDGEIVAHKIKRCKKTFPLSPFQRVSFPRRLLPARIALLRRNKIRFSY
jgi:CheY-like chemotaxis protein